MPALPDPTNSTRSTPSITAANATLHIGSSSFIRAPSTKVWSALTDTSTWPSWNTFVPRVTIRSQPDSPHPSSSQQSQPPESSLALSPILQTGTKFTMHVRMDPASTKPQAARDVQLIVTECVAPDPESRSPGRIVWIADYEAAGSLPRALLAAERVHEVTDVDGEVGEGEAEERSAGTEVRNWEAQVGWVVYAVKWLYGKRLQSSFEGWVDDLRGFVEGGV